jgi:predicted GIY-YIG superfamily endonuclease
MQTTVYTLQLENNCWYVGTTKQTIAHRLAQHQEGRGSEWTRLHAPITVLRSVQFVGPIEDARLSEDAEVKRMMRLHGIANVRGGTYARVRLGPADVGALRKELNHAAGQCLRCGSGRHWVRTCPLTSSDEDDDDAEEDDEPPSKRLRGGASSRWDSWETDDEDDGCMRCGRPTHTTEQCYATTHRAGGAI